MVISSLMVPGEYGQIFCVDIMCFHCNKSSRQQMEMVENVDTDSEGSKDAFGNSRDRKSGSHLQKQRQVVLP